MENNPHRENMTADGLVESSSLYQCIRPLLLLQKVGGGWIHRQLISPGDKRQYYTFKIYCIFWEFITIGALIRIAVVFGKDISIKTENMLTFMQTSLYVTTSINQFASIFKYRKILPFWDGMLFLTTQRSDAQLKKTKVIMWVMVVMAICNMAAVDFTGFAFVLKPDPAAAYIKLAEPWSGNVKEARIAFMTTIICFLPSYITWTSACLYFLTAGFYLRRGFRDQHILMENDLQLVDRLALHKLRHIRLSNMTQELDDILLGYIGPSIAMCTFDLCFVIFTLHDGHSSTEVAGSAAMLLLALSVMAIIVVISISINTWVSIKDNIWVEVANCLCVHERFILVFNSRVVKQRGK